MRTKGAKDLKIRKRRKDRKNKYRKSRKTGKLVLYVSKRKKTDPIKLWFWAKEKISKDGHYRLPKHLRYIRYKTVFVGRPILVYPEEISNRERIEQLAINIIQYSGVFYLMMPSGCKNSYHVSFKKKAMIKIVDIEDGLRAKVFWDTPLKRYWFYKER
jgi:hypothetical protein